MKSAFICCILAVGLAASAYSDPPEIADRKAGSTIDGGLSVADGKLVQPAGDLVSVAGKPMDVVAAPDGSLLFVKSRRGVAIVNVGTFKVAGTLALGKKDGEGSMHGLAVQRDAGGQGWTVYMTTTEENLMEGHVAADGTGAWSRRIAMGDEFCWGTALSPDGKRAYVCRSAKNDLAVVDLESGRVIGRIPVGVAPYDVCLSPDGRTAFVSNFGGSHPRAGQATEKSAGTDVAVDKRSIPIGGTVSKVDLISGTELGEIATGLHPTQIARDAAGSRYYAADANSDAVTVIDADRDRVAETIAVRPDPGLPFGSIPDALALSLDGKRLYVADAGNDAVAVISVDQEKSLVRGFVPTGWFPGGITCIGDAVFIANTKSNSVSRVASPDGDRLAGFTNQVMSQERVPQILRERERAQSGVKPVPVPARVGEPSVFRHVVYILKENKTYDQVLGDIGRGNSDPKLCVYGRKITPNQHALANQLALLDNYYCNGVNSSDGHQWATQGIIGEYFEKGSRTYDFGTDPLCYASSDFIWDSCLLHGLSVRNYGEFDFPSLTAGKTWFDVYGNWRKTGNVGFRQKVDFDTLMRFTCHDYPGWNLAIPDAFRVKVFLNELAGYERAGELPDFLLVYLPQDHTSGTKQSSPTPRAMVADNDLATGQVVEAISKSRFWKDTCIFVNEDDPQSGYDHVDGHRSFCLIVSPFTKRETIISHFYNQTSVLHTMTQILGLPPMNQACAAAATMDDCFTDTPDLRPYECLPNIIPLDERNPVKQAMSAPERKLSDQVDAMDFSLPDQVDEDKLNRLIWLASGRRDPYPAEFAGPHGKGLAALHLKLDQTDSDGDGDGD